MKFRYIFFTLGLLLFFSSFAFFQNLLLSLFLLVTGFGLTLVSFLKILFDDGKKTKIIFTLILIGFLIFRHSITNLVITKSYDHIITKHEKLFTEMNKIFLSKKGDIVFPSDDKVMDSIFSKDEKNSVNIFLKTTPVHYIRKYNSTIYYSIWGALDSDYGIFFITGPSPNDHFIGIRGNWYFD